MKLLLTLGHNSSAILVEDGKVLCGYEEERLSCVKSDSSFPVLSIKKILEYYPNAYTSVKDIFVSHWFWDFNLTENKYYRPKFLSANFPNAKVTSVDANNTHHDLHAKSLWNFLDGDRDGITIVADGFGNFGECLSIYIDGRLKHRSYEVQYSMGLMYQYAIRYLGMKENQDEYKLLGYEQSVTKEDKTRLEADIKVAIDGSYRGLMDINPMKHDMATELTHAWDYWEFTFRSIDSDNKDRGVVAYFTQQVLEGVMMSIVKHYNIKNIKVSGGVFYNVKLNNMLLRYSDRFEANPLAGDQGCSLGFVNVQYDNLNWGIRNIDNIFNITNSINDLKVNGYAEIFKGNMEFGPRALGNTTCLVVPTMKNVEYINKINGRDTIMPMAPVITEDFMLDNFKDIEKVGKSKYFMIIAYDYREIKDKFRGAAHYDSDRDVYTGRFQLLDDKSLEGIVNHFGGILINTSLNAHGQPILYDDKDYLKMIYIQSQVAKD